MSEVRLVFVFVFVFVFIFVFVFVFGVFVFGVFITLLCVSPLRECGVFGLLGANFVPLSQRVLLPHQPHLSSFNFFSICVNVYICICINVYICSCISNYICICITTYICICINIYICICFSFKYFPWVKGFTASSTAFACFNIFIICICINITFMFVFEFEFVLVWSISLESMGFSASPFAFVFLKLFWSPFFHSRYVYYISYFDTLSLSIWLTMTNHIF